MKELVSIIVPVYNAEAFLDRCINSLVKQTYENLEIILVDDGSIDRSSSICDLWSEKDQRIKTIHKQNAGAGMARNTGIECAKGCYVLFVDSDDYIDTDTVKKCVENSKKNNADVVMFGRCNVSADGTMINKHITSDKLVFTEKEVVCDVLPGFFTYENGIGISAWGKMFNLDIIRTHNIRFCSERELLSEDAFFILEIFAHISCASIMPECLYFYCENGNSISRKYKNNHQELNDAFLMKSMKLCKEYGYPESVSLHVKARYHMYTISGMKKIVASTLSTKDKHIALRCVFGNGVLRNTLTADVLKLEKLSERIFWRLFGLHMYHICYILLWYKVHR